MSDTQTLRFVLRRSYGTDRYYPDCSYSRAICSVAGRVCLTADLLALLAEPGTRILIRKEGEETWNQFSIG